MIQHYPSLDYQPCAQQAITIACAETEGRSVAINMVAGQGFGCINAWKMHYRDRSGWAGTTHMTHIDTSGE